MSARMEQGEHLPHDEREVVLRARFHERDADGRLWVSLRFLRGPRHPRAGESVYLLDGEGRGCLGSCVLVRGWAALVELDPAGLDALDAVASLSP